MIEEASKGFEKNFGSDDFYVVFYPPGACTPRLIPYLDEARVKYLDYSSLFTFDDDGLWIPDGHPTAFGHKLVAEQLAADLGIAADK